MMKRWIPVLLVVCIALVMAGCGAAEPQQAQAPTESPAATPDTTATPGQTPAPAQEASPTPPPDTCPAIDRSDILAAQAGSVRFRDYTYEDTPRRYLLYIPEGLAEGAPMVFVLHGYYGQAYSFIEKTGMNEVADAHGFAVVYPQGLPAQSGEFPGSHWNADFTFSEEDDVGFLTELAASLQQTYGFSPYHTFVTGLSNGGFMCYTLAVRSPETFRAIAPVAGLMSKETWAGRDVTDAPVPVLHIHGTADATVPIDGTMMENGGWGGAPELEETIQYWVDRDGLDSMTEDRSGNLYGRKYAGGGSDALVWYYLIEGFGHDWPTEENAGLDTGELIWAFFSNYLD